MDLSLNKLREKVKDREAWRAAVHGGCKESGMTKQLNNCWENKDKSNNDAVFLGG